MTMTTRSGPQAENPLAEVVAWLDHEASLLEILTYRLNGLANVLRSSRHAMVCTAASDVETVHDQLIRAAVNRDLALLALASDPGGPLPSADELDEAATSDLDRQALMAARGRIREAVAEVDGARDECALAATIYRPS